VVDYPPAGLVFFQFLSELTLNVLQNAPILDDITAAAGLSEAAVTLLSRAATASLPTTPVKTYLPDALHFQRGIHNIRVLDLEVEMPLTPRQGRPGVPDFDKVRRAWWDAILTCYRHSDTCPQRMPLEMRITGGSEVVMAAQRGNQLGTCSIEVLTLRGVEAALWQGYAQEVLDKWMGYKDAEGKGLRTRPHWAKQWAGLEVGGRPWVERLKEVDYKEAIAEFKAVLGAIGKEHGWNLDDLRRRFSNDLFDSFYFDGADSRMVNGNGKAH